MTEVSLDLARVHEARRHSVWNIFLLVCAGLAVTGFWIFTLFVLLPLVTGQPG